MRTFRTAVFILGLLSPLVIQAQPFGETDFVVFDTDFLPAPPGPAPAVPEEAPAPPWLVLVLEPAVTDRSPPPIPFPEPLS